MTWLAWRQFRTQAFVTLALLAAFAALVLVTGLHLRDVCHVRIACRASDAGESTLADLLGPALLAIPALLGMFWGAPLIARELESGTYRLAWTQSVTRRRWLSVRVVIVGVAALAVAGLASWLVSWWFAPLDAVNMNRFDPSVFTARGIVAIGYAGFAFALGVGAGALTRRTLAAMAATLLGFIAARIAFTSWVRPHLLSTKYVVFSPTQGNVGFVGTPTSTSLYTSVPTIPNAWPLSATLVDRARHPLTIAQNHALLVRYCPTLATGLPRNPGTAGKSPAGMQGGVFVSCQQALSKHLQLLVSYQPASHYWPLQALEAGIFLAAALAVIAATIWWVGRRGTHRPAVGGPTQPTANRLAPEVSAPPMLPADDGGRSTRRHRQRRSPSRQQRRA